MDKIRFTFISLFLLLNTLFIYSESFVFYEFDFPPFLITDKNQTDQGILNYFKNSFFEEFSEFEIQKEVSNNMKIWSELNKKDNVIVGAGIKTAARMEIGLFSKPYLLLLPNGIIIQKSKLAGFEPYLNEIGEVKLEALITDSRLKGGISLEQSYGEVIDEIINRHRYNKNIYPDYYKSFNQKIETINNGELDYVFGYPVEAKYFMANNPNIESEIINLPIEGVSEYTLLHMVVSKSETGENIIGKINSFIDQTIVKKEFHEKYEYWLTDETKEIYRRYVSDVFKISY